MPKSIPSSSAAADRGGRRLERDNALALYAQLAELLKRELAEGHYEPSGRLPSESELMQRFGLSRVTVRLAVAALEQQGIAERIQGKGTFAVGKRLRHGLNTLVSFHQSLKDMGLAARIRLQGVARAPLPVSLRKTWIEKSAECLRVSRLHLVDAEPIAVGISELPLALEDSDWKSDKLQPIYLLIEARLDVHIARADIAVRARAASEDIARALKIKSGAPVLVMERRTYTREGHCCDHTLFHIRPERYEFVLSSDRIDGKPLVRRRAD